MFGVLREQIYAIVIAAALAATASAQEVIPDFYKDPGLSPNRSYVNQNFSEHIDPFTGALQLHSVDIRIPGNGGFDLSVVRSYNSASVDPTNPAAYESLAGLGWTIHFGRILKTKDTMVCSNTNGLSVVDNPVIELPDGSRQLLTFTGGTSPLALTTQFWRADCYGAAAGLSVYSPDGVRYDMTQLVAVSGGTNPVYAWYTKKITDRNGNTVIINYRDSASPEITSISASDGRNLTFSYADSGLASRRITSITGASGQTYTYSYTAVSGVTDKYFLTSVIRPDGTSWKYSYNGNLDPTPGGYIVSRVTYPEGGYINYSYDFVYFDSQANPSSRSTVVVSKTLSTGANWSFSYAPGGPGAYDTTRVSTPSGTIAYQHIGPNYSSSGTVWMVGLLMSKQIGSAQTETYTWAKQKISSENYFRPGAFVTKVDSGETSAPMLASRTVKRDGATYATTYSNFDRYGNPGTISESGPSSRTTSVTYYIDTAKWIVKQRKDESVSGGVSITRTFDGGGNLQSISRDGVTTSYLFDGQGNVTQATFPRSLVHTYSSYRRGIAQGENQPEGITVSRAVSDAGNVTSETNGEGKTTTYRYDGLNRLTGITYPRGNAVTISYGAASKVATRGSLSESINYDGFGRPSTITLGGVSRTYRHDALGRRTFESNPGASSGTSYQYDVLDRVTSATNADGTSRRISYGAGSRTVTDERSKSTTYSYRSYGDPEQQMLMSISAADASANVALQRNGKDLITSITQGGVTRSYGYNSQGYLTSVVNPETGTTTYGRDSAGNMTSRAVGTSGSTTYTYDGQNRLTAASYPGSTPSVTKTYSKTHKLKTVNSSVASHGYSYDANDNLTSETLTVDGISSTTGYGYTSNDQLSSLTYPRTGRVVSYSPDTLGRPTQVSGFVSGVGYWPSGQIKQISYLNGATASYGQNSRLWPSSLVAAQSGAIYLSSSYSYDGAGNLTSIADTADNNVNRTLGYDNINRLISVASPWGSGTFAYDGAGNLKSQSFGGNNLSYAYDGNNRLSTVSGERSASYGYDAYGDITSAGTNTYAYDGVPNLTCVNCTESANKIQYQYEGLNQRVSVTKGGVKTYEVYGSNGNLLLEYTPAPAARVTEYIYLGGRRVAQVDSKPTSTTLTTTPNPAVVKQTVTLTATVTGNTPGGAVSFKDNGALLSTVALSDGQASFTTSYPVIGLHTLVASYAGDANNDASDSTATTLIVNGTPTSTTLSMTPNPMWTNQQAKFTASVTGANNPTGTVTFMDGATALGASSLNSGQASLVASVPGAGTHNVTANYAGDSANAASTSAAGSLTVLQSSATTSIWDSSSGPTSSLKGQPVTLRVVISGGAGAQGPTGTVTFQEGSTILGTANVAYDSASGRYMATLQIGTLAPGTHSITAYYSGDAPNYPSTSSVLVQTVDTKLWPGVWLTSILQILLDD